MSTEVLPDIALIGLGNMGSPMAARLIGAGYRVTGFDLDPAARDRLTANGGTGVATAVEAARAASVVILMLPNSTVVEAVVRDLLDAAALAPGSVVVDMSSSDPASTRELAQTLSAADVTLVDAPVSGGVKGAENGKLTIMVGGSPEAFDTVRPVLESLGTPRLGGDVGAGHAIKAINNLLSATHLLATAEAAAAAQRFGLDPAVLIDMVNTSSGRSGSTDNKYPNFILPGTYDSGFALALMLKDMKIATDLAAKVGAPALLGEQAVAMWERAQTQLEPGADHTEIARWIDNNVDDPVAEDSGADSEASKNALAQRIRDIHGTWDDGWQSILDLRPTFLAAYADLAEVPWKKNHLDDKTKELIYLAVDAAATHLHSPGVRQHIRAALDHGATPDEIMETIKLTATLGIHAMNIGVPLSLIHI